MAGSCEQSNGPSGYIEDGGISLPDERVRVYQKFSGLSHNEITKQ
jgi:hypothetical protein